MKNSLISRSGLLCVGAVAVLACSLGCTRPPENARTPNVILVSLDTLRADSTGVFGSERDVSPNLDRVASESVAFDRAIAQCSHTIDSHMSLFQSRYPTRTTPEQVMLAQVLKASGFQTAAFTGGGFMAADLGFGPGFDHYEAHPDGFEDSIPAAKAWLDGVQSPDTPFFVFLHTYDIHAPYDPAQEYVELFADTPYEGPLVPAETHAYQREMLEIAKPDPSLARVEWNEEDREYFETLYDAGIRETDAMFGELLQWLDGHPAWDWDRDLLVIFSDHGEEFWDHGSVGHGFTLYQEQISVPLLIRFPGKLYGGSRVAETVELMDVAPTILDILGIEAPEGFFGDSLVPHLSGEGQVPPDVAASLTVRGYRTIIDYPWKLILSGPENVELLYNLEEDPREQNPLGEEFASVVEQLKAGLAETLKGEIVRHDIVDPSTIQDPEVLEQLRALGYVE